MSEEEGNVWTSRIGRDYAVRIPKPIREKYKLKPEDVMIWRLREDGVLEVEFYGIRRFRKSAGKEE